MVVKPARTQALALFRSTFRIRPRVAASAPGRVNLIGEHTDYNGGPVLPMAIAARTVVVAGRGDPGVLDIVSTADGRRVSLQWQHAHVDGFGAYVQGVMLELAALALVPGNAGARLAVASDVPIGAGLSSSAALTVSTAQALSLLFLHRGARRPTGRQLAGIAFRAEHDRVGVRCGVMDQSIAALGKPGKALLLECASLDTRPIPVPAETKGRFLLVDTGVRHTNASNSYNTRRAECDQAVERLRLELPELIWLASWPAEWNGRLERVLSEPLRSRALHVVSETARTREAARLLERGRWKPFGRLMFESHESCRRLYECSAPELDLVVDTAREAGALGARMTGAGWGGAAIVLVEPAKEARIVKAVTQAFRAKFGRAPGIMLVRASGGVRRERI